MTLTRALFVFVALTSACAPARRPETAAPPPARVEPRPTPVPTSWTFGYAAGAPQYRVSSVSAVEVKDDTSQARDSVTMSMRVTFGMSESGGRLLVAGTVDSFVVTSGGRVPPTPNDSAGRPGDPVFAFRGEVGVAGLRLDPTAFALAANCDSPAGALAAAVADILPPIPRDLVIGQRWTDTTSSTVCRGDIPVTARAIHQYEFKGPIAGIDDTEDTRLRSRSLWITRASVVSLSGNGTPRGQAVTISGTGTAERSVVINMATGRLNTSSATSVTSLTISNEIKSVRFEQRSKTHIEGGPR